MQMFENGCRAVIYVPSPPPIRDFVLVVRKDYGGEVPGANADFPAIPGVTAEAVTGCPSSSAGGA